MAEDTEVHRIAVRLLDPNDQHLLACNWLWHGQSIDEALADLFIRLGLPSSQAVDEAARARLVSVDSAPRRSHRHRVVIHVLSLDFVVAAEVTHRLASPPAGLTRTPLNLCAEEDRLDETLTAWSEPGWTEPRGGHVDQDAVLVQRPGTYAVLGKNGRILLTQLSRTGWWTLPGGGIDMGEQPSAAVVREVYEETGLPLQQVELLGVTTANWTGRGPDGVEEDFHAVQILYTGEVPDEAPQVMEVDGSTSKVEWVDVATAADRPLTYVALSGLRILGMDLQVP